MINPAFVRTFLSLVETRHFTRTADALHMTQPGVSQHLKKLEAELGVALFDRHGKIMELTPAGERFLEYAQAQASAETAMRDSLTEDSAYAGECHLACSGTLAMQLYPKLLEVQKTHRQLGIHMEAAPDRYIVDQVLGGDIVFGLVTSRPNSPDLEVEQLGTEALCLALPKGHAVDFAALKALGYINHPNGAHYADQVLGQNFPQLYKGFSAFPVSSYINQLTQILLPVSAGLGFTVLPETTVNMSLEISLISKARLRHPSEETVFLIAKKYRRRPKRYGIVRNILQDHWRR